MNIVGVVGLAVILCIMLIVSYWKWQEHQPKRKRKRDVVEIDKYELKELREELEAARQKLERAAEYSARREIEFASAQAIRAADYAQRVREYGTHWDQATGIYVPNSPSGLRLAQPGDIVGVTGVNRDH